MQAAKTLTRSLYVAVSFSSVLNFEPERFSVQGPFRLGG
jgi:hypothetical protein